MLHFYQPPVQTHEIVAKIAEESYRPLLSVLHRFPEARVAININGVLTEMLRDHGYLDVVERLRELGERGQVEFLGSGQFHPIMPRLTGHERRTAIAGNLRINREILGPSYHPTGFFPPELAFSTDIIPDIAASGHKWLLLSGVASPNHWPMDHVPVVDVAGSRVQVLFRDDARSNRISFRQITASDWVADLTSLVPDQHGTRYVVTAMDAETFGHHIAGWEREFLAAAYGLLSDVDRQPVHMLWPSEIVAHFPAGEPITPHASSWSTSGEDIAHGNPLPLWHAPGNRLHSLQWEYVGLVRDVLQHARDNAEGSDSIRMLGEADTTFQPALHSCQFWWASHRPWWEPMMVQRGLNLLTQTLLYAERSVLTGAAPEAVKREVRWHVAAANDVRVRLERALFDPEHA